LDLVSLDKEEIPYYLPWTVAFQYSVQPFRRKIFREER
jgi:hypothetical protein